MIKTTAILISELPGYVNPKAKIGRMVEKGEIIPIFRGLYEDDPETSPLYLANCIYGPSYISFEYALSYYNLTSKKGSAVTCAAFGKRKEKRYETLFGSYTYRDIPKKVFHKNLVLHNENGYSFIIASPEKALCDALYNAAPASNLKELNVLLFDEIGIGKRKINRLDPEIILNIADLYGCRNLHLMKSWIRKKYGRTIQSIGTDN